MIRDLGCIVCINQGIFDSPAVIHHPRCLAGAGMKAPEHCVIPLCPMHHTDGGEGIAIHAGEKRFEMLHGTEIQLLDQVLSMVHLRLRAF